ncbi:MAG TPA: nucleotidyltransferase [Epulopiscium sp.]|nr:nucleotidyltransferase [Candidatus Epulonipiscium sp.]
MNVVGIIAEYNPFHNGHLHHLEQSRLLTESNYTVVVMSPNFVQRGAPAITNKWLRTKMALVSGADLVIELPTPYATASAEFFSHASVSLLHHTGIVNAINFGSESNNIDLLTQISKILVEEPDQFKALLKENLNDGVSFPRARAKALFDYCHFTPNLSLFTAEIKEIIQTPNNILGIEYLKALNKLGSTMTPTTIQRKGSGYHQAQLSGQLSSATAIRSEVHKGNWDNAATSMPPSSYDLLYDALGLLDRPVQYKDLSPFLCYRLLFSTPHELRGIMDITEGIENRILKAFGQTQDIEEMVTLIKSKRFTQTTIQRMLLNIILHITKQDFYTFQEQGGPQYIRVLGFRKSSEHLLTELKAHATLPIVMNPAKDYETLPPLAKRMLNMEIRSTNVYATLQNATHHLNMDYTHPLVII